MSLEPVILNEVQLKAAETQTKIDTQTQTLVADNATKRDEINAHSSAEVGQAIAGINNETAAKLAEQTTTLQQTVADSEEVVTQQVIQEASRVIDSNTSTIETSRDEVKSHVTSEANRVIAATGSDGGRYGHEVIISVSAQRNIPISSILPLVITPPSGCFVRITLLYFLNGEQDVLSLDTSKSTLPLYILNNSASNYHLFGARQAIITRIPCRIGGRAHSDSSGAERGDGFNPVQYFDGAIGQPLRITSTSGTNSSVRIAHQIIRVE